MVDRALLVRILETLPTTLQAPVAAPRLATSKMGHRDYLDLNLSHEQSVQLRYGTWRLRCGLVFQSDQVSLFFSPSERDPAS